MSIFELKKILSEPGILIAISFLVIIFFLGLKRTRKSTITKEYKNEEKDYDVEQLTKYEEKLIALKDLYNQELIDAVLYEKKIDIISKKLSVIVGENISEVGGIKQKLIMDALKKNIRSKVVSNISDSNEINIEANIDNLINAVDNKINQGRKHEKN